MAGGDGEGAPGIHASNRGRPAGGDATGFLGGGDRVAGRPAEQAGEALYDPGEPELLRGGGLEGRGAREPGLFPGDCAIGGQESRPQKRKRSEGKAGGEGDRISRNQAAAEAAKGKER